ncbi:MAG: M14 family metallocarboxypeptidase [Verrucomicrobia bacterium]|nr:M14 family metallocarboxypeptidase [Verrucomicrobiota bacterium]
MPPDAVPRFSLQHHRGHDVPYLLQRWRELARTLRIPVVQLAEHDGYPLVALTSGWENDGFYVSAGIHGDEAASTEGLLLWAQRGGLAALQRRGIPFFVAPCLNPWGLANNVRYDRSGRDLNRCFGPQWLGPNAALRDAIAGRKFALALTLHEDFDAQGLYLYEVRGPRPYWGERLAACVAEFLPADVRTDIEGRRAKAGVIRPRLDAKTREFLETGVPEALWLRFAGHAQRIFTFETPSEYALDVRVEAQVTLVETAVGFAFGTGREKQDSRGKNQDSNCVKVKD